MKVLVPASTTTTTENSFKSSSSTEDGDETTRSDSYQQQQAIFCFQCSEEGFTEVATCFCEDCKLGAVTTRIHLTEPHIKLAHYFCSYHGTRHSKSNPNHHVIKPVVSSSQNGVTNVSCQQQVGAPSFYATVGSLDSFSSSVSSSIESSPSMNHSFFSHSQQPLPPHYFSPSLLSNHSPHLHTIPFHNNFIHNFMSGGSNNSRRPFDAAHLSESPIECNHNYPMCHEHQIPINTYCRTCEQLICSVCALFKSHTGHMFDFIQDVEQRERQEIKESLQIIQNEIERWEDEFQTSDSDLDKTCMRIDQVQLALSHKVQNVVDELKRKLDEHSRIIKQNIEEVCQEHKNVIHSVQNIKQQVANLYSEFDHLDEMSGFDLIEKKLSRLNALFSLCAKLKNEFPYESTRQLYDMKIEIDEQGVKAACEQIEQLSHIVKIEPLTSDQSVGTNTNDQSHDLLETLKKQQPSFMKKSISIVSNSDENSNRLNYESIGFIGNASKRILRPTSTSNAPPQQPSNVSQTFSTTPLKCPTDVAISHLHSCLVVSEWGQQQIHLFDLYSKQLKYSFSIPSAPRNLAIDSNVTQYLSIVVSASDNLIYKYDIVIPHLSPILPSNHTTNNHSHFPTLLNPNKERKTATTYDHRLVWISGKQQTNNTELPHQYFKYPRGIAVEKAIRNLNNNYEIYVCDHGNHRIVVLNSVDGSVIRTIGESTSTMRPQHDSSVMSNTEESSSRSSSRDDGASLSDSNRIHTVKFKRPWGITLYKNKYLIISEKRGNRIQMITREGEYIAEFPTRQDLEVNDHQESSVKIYKPRGLLMDPSNKDHVLLVDGGNHRLVLCNIRTGQVLTTFGNLGNGINQFYEPHGICLNELTGEIYVADCNNHCVHVLGLPSNHP
ncbi:hypothetical protein C9374_005813 [Naegleria lovaniensis]|uniref:B box-type domain-containing protein n=1 Tax=Naegleria lovaniensis TaxID=51637 RepID=A0AA88GJ87_NAELO|nr:uncharacterized protein C9374_005813 [Naegleria lovaniensis]KAG2382021.1 hypothetical protein C9374_005813 [Naegleria lovaniensis]